MFWVCRSGEVIVHRISGSGRQDDFLHLQISIIDSQLVCSDKEKQRNSQEDRSSSVPHAWEWGQYL